MTKLGAFSEDSRLGGTLSPLQAFQALETALGHPLALTRHYLSWDGDPSRGDIAWSIANGKTPIISWHPFIAGQKGGVGSGACKWTDISNGSQDAIIVAFAQKLAALNHEVWFSFHHEPEDDMAPVYAQADSGTSASQFVLAWRHVRHIMRTIAPGGVPLVKFGVSLMGATYRGGHGGPDVWMPPMRALDFIASDGYNRAGQCGSSSTWQTFDDVFGPAGQYALLNKKPLLLQEVGCVEDLDAAGETKAQWLAVMEQRVQLWGNVIGVSYSDVYAAPGGVQPYCNYHLDSSPESFAAFQALQRSATFA